MTAATLNSIHTDKIPNGTKFVALFSDGNGASLFHKDENGGMFMGDNEEISGDAQDWLAEAGYSHWIELPNDFKLWGERE